MGRNPVTDIAGTMPQMIAARLYLEDYEALAVLPDGTLTVDLLERQAVHASGPTLSLRVMADLIDWLAKRLTKEQIMLSDLTKAELSIVIRTDRIPADKTRIVPFDFLCSGTFTIKDRTRTSKPISVTRWYTRGVGVSD